MKTEIRYHDLPYACKAAAFDVSERIHKGQKSSMYRIDLNNWTHPVGLWLSIFHTWQVDSEEVKQELMPYILGESNVL